MHAISSYRARPPAHLSATDRGDYNTLRRSLARSVITVDTEITHSSVCYN